MYYADGNQQADDNQYFFGNDGAEGSYGPADGYGAHPPEEDMPPLTVSEPDEDQYYGNPGDHCRGDSSSDVTGTDTETSSDPGEK